MTDSKRISYFLPNTFTALNMACGFICIMLTMKGEFQKGSYFLLLGAIFDMVDGRVARLTGTESAFGEQFDSMSDLISFGMAPALLFYYRFLTGFGRLGMVLTFLFLLCGALRLARFNANIEKVNSNYFQGLPIPTAALGIIGLTLLSVEFEFILKFNYLGLGYIFLYAILMVTNIPFPSFKKSDWVQKHKKQTLFFIMCLLALILVYEEIMIAVIITVYVFGSILYYLTHKSKFQDVFNWKNEEDHA
ncbi:MAG: CDP-diacylglycerol--serine O-phosphatidyltransferase [Bacteriovoracaceae bacterium]|jgi:CDP-diacylglycerol---serine O-phosphatidyltransferase|nr:CDP-diacylglycerol--serine O-phosphatidyltransferase [Bacteriovoracaceae bacterium]